MILLTPLESGAPCLEKGIFLSFEMARIVSEQVNAGNISFNTQFVPAHLPWEGLFRPDFGDADSLSIDINSWERLHLPAPYRGESLEKKNVILFPMHGLGDQLYLAATIRHLASLNPGARFSIVKPSIQSSDQWYDYIYFDDFFNITGPVVNIQELSQYDFYVDAEHFAHLKGYEGTYPPQFYAEFFFQCTSLEAFASLRPEISTIYNEKADHERIQAVLSKLKTSGKPVVFCNSSTTGRVRDIPRQAVIEFVELAGTKAALILSAFKNPELAEQVKSLKDPFVHLADDLVNSIDSLIYLIAHVDYVITSDSGITHLAEAVETPCGSVFNAVTPDERTGPYRFSEQLMVEFGIPGVCQTPCYVHALADSDSCPGMIWKDESEERHMFRSHAPCMENFKGDYLLMLLDELMSRFPESSEDAQGLKSRNSSTEMYP